MRCGKRRFRTDFKGCASYLPSSGQSVVSVFAKFLELQNTIHFFHSSKGNMEICSQTEKGPGRMLDVPSNACHGPAKEKLNNMINTLLMLQMLELS